MNRFLLLKNIFLFLLFAMVSEAGAFNKLKHSPRNLWHSGDIRHFEIHDREKWSRGYWTHTTFEGRLGWWWVVGSSWYYYSRPIYPYPDPYRPTLVIEQEKKSQQTSPAMTASQNWYYCEASKEYYPYVETCPKGWKKVPVIPNK